MRDYRSNTYHELYKLIGFFTVIATVYTISFKATSWILWAQAFVDSNI